MAIAAALLVLPEGLRTRRLLKRCSRNRGTPPRGEAAGDAAEDRPAMRTSLHHGVAQGARRGRSPLRPGRRPRRDPSPGPGPLRIQGPEQGPPSARCPDHRRAEQPLRPDAGLHRPRRSATPRGSASPGRRRSRRERPSSTTATGSAPSFPGRGAGGLYGLTRPARSPMPWRAAAASSSSTRAPAASFPRPSTAAQSGSQRSNPIP